MCMDDFQGDVRCAELFSVRLELRIDVHFSRDPDLRSVISLTDSEKPSVRMPGKRDTAAAAKKGESDPVMNVVRSTSMTAR